MVPIYKWNISSVLLAARKSRTLRLLAFDEKSTYNFFFALFWGDKARYSCNVPVVGTFFRYLFKFRPAFPIQFQKFVWPFPAKLQSKNLGASDIVWNFLIPFFSNLRKISVQHVVGLLEHKNS